MPEIKQASPRLDGVRVLVLFGGSELFGQERANIEVFRSLSELGIKARFVTSSRWGAQAVQPELSRQGFEWTTAPFGFHWGKYLLGKYFYYLFRNLWGVAATSWRVWREARHWKATHLYAPNWLHLSYATLALPCLRLPLIYRAGDRPPQESRVQKWIYTRLLCRAAIVVCISKFIRNQAREIGLPEGKLRIIYSVPPRRVIANPKATPPFAATDRPVVLFVGQLAEFKGVKILIDAAERMMAQGMNFNLWLAGKASWGTDFERTLAERVASPKFQGRVKLHGYIDDVDSLFAQATVHVCPSICHEALGNVVLEAKAASVPSVVFPDGGLPELIEHKVDGFVCECCTTEALVEGVRFFLDEPERRRRAANAARANLEKDFGLERFQREWTHVFAKTNSLSAEYC